MKTPSAEFGIDLNPIDAAEAIVSTARDALSSVGKALSGIPGGNLIVDAVNQGASWASDIASTSEGTFFLRAMATVAYGPIAGTLGIGWFGPQIASVVWALPGVVRGEPFIAAWTQEFAYRAEKTAEALGGEAADAAFDQLAPTIKTLVAQAQSQFPGLNVDQALKQLNVTPQQLADELGIRTDVAMLAIEYIKGEAAKYDLDSIDVTTGRPMADNIIAAPPPTEVVHHLGRVYAATNPLTRKEQLEKLLDEARTNHAPATEVMAIQAQLDAVIKTLNDAATTAVDVPNKPASGLYGKDASGVQSAVNIAARKAALFQAKPSDAHPAVIVDIKASGLPASAKAIAVYSKAPSTAPQTQSASQGESYITPETGIGVAGGATAGFLVAGPVGAAVGAVAGFLGGLLIGKK